MTAPTTGLAETPGEASTPLLELVDVRAGYGPIEVLHGVNLALHPGSVVALLGPTGGRKLFESLAESLVGTA